MSSHPGRRAARLLPGAVLTVLLAGLLGCSTDEPDAEPGDSESSADAGTPTPTPTETEQPKRRQTPRPKPYLPVPKGVRLTPPGSTLPPDGTATLAWRPDPDEDPDGVGVLDLKVRDIVEGDADEFEDWRLPEDFDKTRPYFVHITATNGAKFDLSGARVPLLAISSKEALVQQTVFTEDFSSCGSRPLPDDFTKGEKVEMCLVYLVPGKLTGVAFRPRQDFDPIVWSRPVEPDKSDKDDKKGKTGKKGGSGKGQGDGGGESDKQDKQGEQD